MISEFQSFIEKYQDGNDVFLATDSKNQIWLRATEVCKKLEFTDAHRTVKTYLKEHQYQELRLGRGRPALYISESGFYKLIVKSKSLLAENFIDWITEEVLPKLRASGGYIMPSATSKQLEALQSEITNMKAQKQALFSPLGGYDLDGFWQLMMNHGVVYLKDSNGSRGIYKRIVNILNRIDAEKPELVICQRVGRHNFKSIFARCLVLSTDTWISVIKEAGITPDKCPKFFKLFE
jgi:prophage antirepressor-like protein